MQDHNKDILLGILVVEMVHLSMKLEQEPFNCNPIMIIRLMGSLMGYISNIYLVRLILQIKPSFSIIPKWVK